MVDQYALIDNKFEDLFHAWLNHTLQKVPYQLDLLM